MALIGSNVTSGGSDTDASSYATASISPTSNNLILLAVSSVFRTSADPNQPTVTGLGLTWVAIGTVVYDNTSSSRRRLTLFRALGTVTPGTLTIDFGGQVQTSSTWVVDQISGIDTSGTNGSGAIVQLTTNSSPTVAVTDMTMTLSAFSNANNGAYGAFGSGNANTVSEGSGFTMLGHDNSPADGVSTWTEFQSANDTTVDFTFSSDPENGGIAIEIKASLTGVSPSSSLSPSASSSSSLSPSASLSPSVSRSPSSSLSPSISPSSSASPSPVEWVLSVDLFQVLFPIDYDDQYSKKNNTYSNKYVVRASQYIRKYIPSSIESNKDQF